MPRAKFCRKFLSFLLVLFPVISQAIDVDDIIIIPKFIVDNAGYSGDLAVDPTNGTLKCIWASSFGELKFKSKILNGAWSETEIIPTLGLPLYADESDGTNRWARKCCGLTVDETGITHIVYGVADGDAYYIYGNSGNWSEPYLIISKNRPTCHPEIVTMGDDLVLIYEDAEREIVREVFEVRRINGTWTSPRTILFADNPDLIKGENGMVYLCGRKFNLGWPDYDFQHDVLFGRMIPGLTDWTFQQVTHSSYRVGKAPRLAIYDNCIYLAWSTSIGNEAAGDWDDKGRLYCARADEPGSNWNVYYSTDTNPLYTVATGDPYSCVAVYSDGTPFYANGKEGVLAVNSSRVFTIWLGNRWSGTRQAQWTEGSIVHLASDGKIIWAISGSSSYNNREVSVSGYAHPSINHLDFDNHPPEFVVVPDTIALESQLWTSYCKAMDPDDDPVRYSLAYGPNSCSIDSITGVIQIQTMDIGTLIIGIKAFDNRGKFDIHYFKLNVIDRIFNVDFMVNAQNGTAPFTTQFTNLSQGPIQNFIWDFGDGQTSLDENPIHIFDQPGSYSIKLKVFGETGLDSLVKESFIEVDPPPVLSNFSATPLSGNSPLTVQFVDSSSGVINSWQWNFGDGTTSSEQTPVHIYQIADTYSVSLTVSGMYGTHKRIRPEYIHVQYPPPVANYSGTPRSGIEGLIVQFHDSSTGNISQWNWDFGDKSTSQDQHPVHQYCEVGDYSVRLYVSGPGGENEITNVNYIQIRDAISPMADFSANPVTGSAPLTVHFTNKTTGDILGYEWNFGDFSVPNGGESQDVNPAYTYILPGIYSVLLTATGPDTNNTKFAHQMINVMESTNIQKVDNIPEDYALYQNLPNPFNLKTQLLYDLPVNAMVEVTIFDTRGQIIKTLIRETQESGQHQLVWDGTNNQGSIVPSGIYIARMRTDRYSNQIKLMLLK